MKHKIVSDNKFQIDKMFENWYPYYYQHFSLLSLERYVLQFNKLPMQINKLLIGRWLDNH